ncbi:hypothetical protein ACWEBX_03410 [Streptomyces sp. NPDC005070]
MNELDTASAAAQETLERSAEELVRLQVVRELRATHGLVYRSLDGMEPPYLVAWDGRFVGEIHRRGPSHLHSWFVLPYDEDEQPVGEPDYSGTPFGTARAAAATLKPGK